MFLAWFDPEKKKPARQKLAEAIERHVEKYGVAPTVCLTSAVEAAELDGDRLSPDIVVRAEPYLPRWTFYVGVDDTPAPALAAA